MVRAVALTVLLFGLDGSAGGKAAMRGLELQYPSTLTLELIGSRDDALVLTNFHGKYGHGGIIPRNPDGAEITVLLEDKKGKSLEQVIKEDSSGDRVVSTMITRINGQPATRIDCEVDFQVFKLMEIRVYVDRGPLIYKFILATYPDAVNRKSFEASFVSILRTVKFVK